MAKILATVTVETWFLNKITEPNVTPGYKENNSKDSTFLLLLNLRTPTVLFVGLPDLVFRQCLPWKLRPKSYFLPDWIPRLHAQICCFTCPAHWKITLSDSLHLKTTVSEKIKLHENKILRCAFKLSRNLLFFIVQKLPVFGAF